MTREHFRRFFRNLLVVCAFMVAIVGVAALIFALAATFSTCSRAHDRWANNEPVPPWVKAVCCGPEDVHHLSPDQVTLHSDGWHIEGYPDPVPVEQALPAPDGQFWAFFKEIHPGEFSRVYCLFTPFSGT